MWFSSRRLAAVLAATALCLGVGATASRADVAPPWPGLPTLPDEDPTRLGYDPSSAPYGWWGAAQVGIAGSIPSKQWVQLPVTLLATHVVFGYPEPTPPRASEFPLNIWAFFVSPKSSKRTYGDSAPIRVRTVAFGSIPVDVTLQVRQQRTRSGTPSPIVLKTVNGNLENGEEYAGSEPIDEKVYIAVTAIKVDGVDLGIDSSCQTSEPGDLNIRGTYAQTPNTPLQGQYDPEGDDDLILGVPGGNASGTLDIGEFGRCATRTGDDISPLLTSALSGPDNPLRIRIGVLNCFTYNEDFTKTLPPPPGAQTPAEGFCNALAPDPTNPDFPNYRTVPQPIDLPDYAPGEQPAP
jgi:hypothetical protein